MCPPFAYGVERGRAALTWRSRSLRVSGRPPAADERALALVTTSGGRPVIPLC